VKCISVFDDKRRFYIVMELMTGGELFDRIVDKEFYSEKEACEIIKPIADAVSYCHKMGIAHRDLKVTIFLLFYVTKHNQICW